MDTGFKDEETGMPVEEKIHPKRRTWVYLGGLLLALMLVGAAFMAGRLLNRQAAASGGPLTMQGPGGSMEMRSEVSVEMEPAPELPATEADVHGIFLRREDNSLFVGTGRLTMTGRSTGDGGVDLEASSDGPQVEVIITGDTLIYKDETLSGKEGPPEDDIQIQQVVAPGTLDEISENTTVVVWGKKTGDRIIANVLLYITPVFSAAPPPGG